MAAIFDRADEIARRLAPAGILPRGWFVLADDECALPGAPAGTAGLLFGNHGGAMWRALAASPEYADGERHPMDRWTRRVVEDAIAGVDGALAAFPFGETLWPFQRWARRAMGIQASPLGLLIHPQWGLWHALRAAVLFPGVEVTIPDVRAPIHPFDGCVEKPCLSACPVEAFSASGFDAAGCRSYLDSRRASDSDSTVADCNEEGCIARDACPVGREWRYPEEEIRFHMAAFRR